MQSKFTEYFKTKTNEDLFNYVEYPDMYEKKAVLTAIHVIESRGLSTPKIEALKAVLQEKPPKAQNIYDAEQTKRTSVPKPVKDATNMIYAGVIIGILNPIVMNLSSDNKLIFSFGGMIWFLILNGIIFSMGYLIYLGAIWIRNVFAGITVISTLFLPSLLLGVSENPTIVQQLFLAQPILYVCATYLLFKSESRAWFKTQSIHSKKLNNNTLN